MSKPPKQPTHGPEYEVFGRNVAAARVALGLSQYDVAEKLGMTQSTYGGYETGTRKVPLSVILKLSEILHKTPDELLGTATAKKNNDFYLSDLEKDIIRKFRTLNNGERAMFLRTIGVEEKGDVAKMA